MVRVTLGLDVDERVATTVGEMVSVGLDVAVFTLVREALDVIDAQLEADGEGDTELVIAGVLEDDVDTDVDGVEEVEVDSVRSPELVGRPVSVTVGVRVLTLVPDIDVVPEMVLVILDVFEAMTVADIEAVLDTDDETEAKPEKVVVIDEEGVLETETTPLRDTVLVAEKEYKADVVGLRVPEIEKVGDVVLVVDFKPVRDTVPVTLGEFETDGVADDDLEPLFDAVELALDESDAVMEGDVVVNPVFDTEPDSEGRPDAVLKAEPLFVTVSDTLGLPELVIEAVTVREIVTEGVPLDETHRVAETDAEAENVEKRESDADVDSVFRDVEETVGEILAIPETETEPDDVFVRIAVNVTTLVTVTVVDDVVDGDIVIVALTVEQGVDVRLTEVVGLREGDVDTETERRVDGEMEGEAVPVDEDDCRAV
jgi:hypothetical protein